VDVVRSDADILAREGFQPIGDMQGAFVIAAWWNPAARVQLLSLRIGSAILYKGSKAYYLTSTAEEGETWARDIGPLHDYLESHFRELHLSFSYVRDVPAFLADRQARTRCGSINGGDESGGGGRAATLAKSIGAHRSLERLRQLDSGDSSLLTEHLRQSLDRQAATTEQLQALEAQARADSQHLRHLQSEYRRKGSAASLIFSISSNLQLVRGEHEIRDAVRSIAKELNDLHRFQVMQTLGGKLRIRAAEATEPSLVWLEQWFGGLLNPNQLEQIRAISPLELDRLTTHVAVTPDEDIVAGNTVVDHRKLLAPRVVSSLLSRLDKTGKGVTQLGARNGPMLNLGLRVEGDGSAQASFELPLSELGHVYISGKTGAGKSVAVRVLIEEAADRGDLGVLVLDPRNQSAGLLAPQDRSDLLARYEAFGLGEPKGFSFNYLAPANHRVSALPDDLGTLAAGKTILSFKGMQDAERCRLFARVLDAVFERLSRGEASSVRLVIFIEEAQLFTRRLVEEAAAPDAQKAESALDRLLREGRKYGISVVVSSQSIKDFARDAAAVRQNTTTKIFLQNSDREIEYARDYLDDSRELVRLPSGQAFICNPSWGVARVAVRPPMSKVWDFSDVETAVLVGKGVEHRLSTHAAALLEGICRYVSLHGIAPNTTQAAHASGITSKRRLQALVRELTSAGKIATRRMGGPGNPCVLEIVGESSAIVRARGQTADTSGLEVGAR